MYIVTQYGCNSTPSDMWIPESKLFINYEEAYAYFLKVSPSLLDEYEEAEQFVNDKYKTEEDANEEYIVIENRVQTSSAKRPEGAVIARIITRSISKS
jgi:hypothetical protein